MKNKMDPDLKNIVLAKIMAYDDDYELVIGGAGPLNKEDLARNVEQETEIGKKIVAIQSDFMHDLINGEIYKMLENV